MVSSLSSNIGALPNAYNTKGAGKIEVPVPSSVSIYAQFKYVRGVPASSSQQPVSLNRAQIIDNMVSYLNKSSDEPSLNLNEEYHMEELEQEIHRVVNEKASPFKSLSGINSDTGVIFDLSA